MKEKIFKIINIFVFSIIMLINLLFLIFMCFHVGIVSLTAFITQNVDIQILFFAIFSVFLGIIFIILIFYKMNLLNKNILMLLFLILQFGFIFFSLKLPSINKINQIDSCLDRGYCWDYIRNKCEKSNQGFCIKNSQECIDRNGLWEKEKQYCIFNDYNVNAAK